MNNIDTINKDILEKILYYLTPKELLNLRLVSHHINQLSTNSLIQRKNSKLIPTQQKIINKLINNTLSTEINSDVILDWVKYNNLPIADVLNIVEYYARKNNLEIDSAENAILSAIFEFNVKPSFCLLEDFLNFSPKLSPDLVSKINVQSISNLLDTTKDEDQKYLILTLIDNVKNKLSLEQVLHLLKSLHAFQVQNKSSPIIIDKASPIFTSMLAMIDSENNFEWFKIAFTSMKDLNSFSLHLHKEKVLIQTIKNLTNDQLIQNLPYPNKLNFLTENEKHFIRVFYCNLSPNQINTLIDHFLMIENNRICIKKFNILMEYNPKIQIDQSQLNLIFNRCIVALNHENKTAPKESNLSNTKKIIKLINQLSTKLDFEQSYLLFLVLKDTIKNGLEIKLSLNVMNKISPRLPLDANLFILDQLEKKDNSIPYEMLSVLSIVSNQLDNEKKQIKKYDCLQRCTKKLVQYWIDQLIRTNYYFNNAGGAAIISIPHFLSKSDLDSIILQLHFTKDEYKSYLSNKNQILEAILPFLSQEQLVTLLKQNLEFILENKIDFINNKSVFLTLEKLDKDHLNILIPLIKQIQIDEIWIHLIKFSKLNYQDVLKNHIEFKHKSSNQLARWFDQIQTFSNNKFSQTFKFNIFQISHNTNNLSPAEESMNLEKSKECENRNQVGP